jgi:hypothetical protein
VTDDRTVFFEDGKCFKLYSLESFISNQRTQLDIYNEYVISRRAAEKQLENIIHLWGVHRGTDHVGLSFPAYQISFRSYLRKHRQPE